jgi:uncharacterized protein YehS (DUF1456 family)
LNNNDVLRSLRYMLDMSEPTMAKVFKLGAQEIARADIVGFLRGEEETGYAACSDEAMLGFLNGLVTFKRGENKEISDPNIKPETTVTNNVILKKLRVAFELKDADMHEVFAKADHQISKPELSALFRKKGHSNYRACGDQILRYFLKGLTLRVRG